MKLTSQLKDWRTTPVERSKAGANVTVPKDRPSRVVMRWLIWHSIIRELAMNPQNARAILRRRIPKSSMETFNSQAAYAVYEVTTEKSGERNLTADNIIAKAVGHLAQERANRLPSLDSMVEYLEELVERERSQRSSRARGKGLAKALIIATALAFPATALAAGDGGAVASDIGSIAKTLLIAVPLIGVISGLAVWIMRKQYDMDKEEKEEIISLLRGAPMWDLLELPNKGHEAQKAKLREEFKRLDFAAQFRCMDALLKIAEGNSPYLFSSELTERAIFEIGELGDSAIIERLRAIAEDEEFPPALERPVDRAIEKIEQRTRLSAGSADVHFETPVPVSASRQPSHAQGAARRSP